MTAASRPWTFGVHKGMKSFPRRDSRGHLFLASDRAAIRVRSISLYSPQKGDAGQGLQQHWLRQRIPATGFALQPDVL